MKTPTRHVHIFLGLGMIQRAQHQAKLTGVMWLNTGGIPSLEKPSDALMPKGLDHRIKV
jgi:hypothetical protein